MSTKEPAIVTALLPRPPTPYPPISPVCASVPKAERAQSATLVKTKKRVQSASGPPSASLLKRRPATSSQIGSSHGFGGVARRRRRIKSAVEDRRVANLVTANSPWACKKWAQSSYSFDYALKKPYPPPTIRPASATRRNNPHPSELFMVWQFPSRIHQHERAVVPRPGAVDDLRERFYADYLKNDNKTGGARYEVPITNVAKIPFPGNMTGKTASKCACQGHGTQQSSPSHSRASHRDGATGRRIKEACVSNEMYQQTFTPPSYKAFQEWVKSAPPEEQKVLLSLLQAASAKQTKMQKLLSEVFNPRSLEQIEKWLAMSDMNEYNKVLHILEQLADDSHQPKRVEPTHHKAGCKHLKGKSSVGFGDARRYPASQSPEQISIIGNAFVKSQRSRTPKSCIHCGKKMTDKSRLGDQSDLLWHHKIKPPQTTKLFRAGSIFGQPQKPRGQHYTLHPEWPTA